MERKETRRYKNDEFKINCIYNKDGKTLKKIIEEAFRGYYRVKMNI